MCFLNETLLFHSLNLPLEKLIVSYDLGIMVEKL